MTYDELFSNNAFSTSPFPEEREITMSHTRPADSVQIMPGTYLLRQVLTEGPATVGKLLVNAGTAPGVSTEKWLLYSTYRWPSSDHTTQSIEFLYQGTPVSESEFLEDAPKTATYIIASCQQQAIE